MEWHQFNWWALGFVTENGGKTLGKPTKTIPKTHSLEKNVHISDVNHFVKSRKEIILQFWTSKCTIQSTQNVKKRDLVKSFHSHLHWWSQFCSYIFAIPQKRQVFCSWCHRPICRMPKVSSTDKQRPARRVDTAEWTRFSQARAASGPISAENYWGPKKMALWCFKCRTRSTRWLQDAFKYLFQSRMKFMVKFRKKQILASGPIDHHRSTFIQPQLVHCSLLWHLHHPRPGPCRMGALGV